MSSIVLRKKNVQRQAAVIAANPFTDTIGSAEKWAARKFPPMGKDGFRDLWVGCPYIPASVIHKRLLKGGLP
ncbi:hypothetical protein TNIN_451301 [Trichonephila inaurata madagascariensis]|uniref:Uncharacterized protein n=1 Tax=Trichonephila inaurata madagascariensis TaxID=2747483 RepID=A0A8X7CUB0_9ARAC|nr:hypothetical protein TNIN_451301 [Trichonephila inaurata madagascariensis]